MKKRVICLLLVLTAVLALCGSVSVMASGAELYYVTDDAGILTEEEDLKLEAMAEQVSQTYGVGVYIVTVEDYEEFEIGTVYETTYTIYHEYNMGEGEDRDGIMLLLSMAERDWAMFCYGGQSEYAFDEYGQEQLEGVFLDDFADDNWYNGFTDYIRACSTYLEQAAEGKPVRRSKVGPVLIAVGGSLFLAFLALGLIWRSMKSVRAKTTANHYISGELNLTESSDRFTHRTETRRKIESNSSGGSSSHSGGGGSGRSGKF